MPERRTEPVDLLPALDGLVERLAEDMTAAWQRGERPQAETFLVLHPELRDDSEAGLRLVYEEVCLRQEYGENVAPETILARFPRWQAQLAVLLDCDRLLGERAPAPCFPEVGDSLGDFRLRAELGRGGQGRVFLATQPSLGERPVVLKVVPRGAREHLSLAHLQHTHIIPLYAVHDFPGSGVQALCMPYLGGASLDRILRGLRGRPLAQLSGRDLLQALDRCSSTTASRVQTNSSIRSALGCLSYAEAVCRIGACLADALQHAHERGLIHLDLKPSNVLLAADTQPLLLDFHLARAPLAAGRTAPAWLGGTPGYMSPEQEAACDAARHGKPIPTAVDGRSDIFSLGRVLFVALGGNEVPASKTASALPRINPQVTPGLADIIDKCLATEPKDRYPDAASLAADLRRHLAGLPLRGVPNRSPRERWRKWRRRHPHAPLLLGVVLALLAVVATVTLNMVERAGEGEAALHEGRELMRDGAYDEAVRTLQRGRERVENVPATQQLTRSLDEQLRLARRAQTAGRLHTLSERLRFLVGTTGLSVEDRRILESRSLAAWTEGRHLIEDASGVALPQEVEQQLRDDVADLAIHWADLHVDLASEEDRPEARQQALHTLDEAQALLGSSPALTREQTRYASSRGADVSPPTTFREHAALGRSLLRSGDLEHAALELQQAVEMQPQDFWANFSAGACAYRRRQYADAVHSFGVALALAPRTPECYYNRALAYSAWGKPAEALRDYDRALQLDPGLAAAALNRGILHYQASRYAEALTDFHQALEHGADPAQVHYNMALVHLALNDRASALASVEQALHHSPAHAEAAKLREQLSQQ
jgi:serine/threonine protein kinase/Flp pilus assembly protein TadD